MGRKKLYYKIGEACKALDIQPYVLRYWETEFSQLSPDKSKSGQRVYSERDLDLIRRVKELLYDEGYTIAGAKKKLEAEMAAGGPSRPPARGSAKGGGKGREGSGAPPELDSSTAEEIEKLRRRIRRSLEEAREILALLSPPDK